MTYQFGSLSIKPSEIKPISQADLISKNIEEERGIFGTDRMLSQREIKNEVPSELQREIFELSLQNGPYRITYESSGEHALICSSQSHVSMIRLEDMHCEFERYYDTLTSSQTFLHNAELEAYARSSCVSILNFQGVELHRLSRCNPVADLEYLRRHMLLADVAGGQLSYTDITNGEAVSVIEADLAFKRISQDPTTAVIAATCQNSKVVRAFAPALKHPLYAVDCNEMVEKCLYTENGRYLVCQCAQQFRVFDIRQTKEEICAIDSRNTRDFAISETGKLAALLPEGVFIGDLETYISHGRRTQLTASLLEFHKTDANYIEFRPYFDNLGVSQNDGVQQILVPGSGSSGFDTFDTNFFAGTRGRNEQLIRQELDKLPWDLIGQGDALARVHKPDIAERIRARNSEVLQELENLPKAKTVRQKARNQKMEKKIESRIQEEISQTNKGAPTGLDRFFRNE